VAKKIKRRPKHSRRHVSLRESTVRRLAAVMDPWESFAEGVDRAVSALVEQAESAARLGKEIQKRAHK
jgi:hypothetical protein